MMSELASGEDAEVHRLPQLQHEIPSLPRMTPLKEGLRLQRLTAVNVRANSEVSVDEPLLTINSTSLKSPSISLLATRSQALLVLSRALRTVIAMRTAAPSLLRPPTDGRAQRR